MPHLLQVMERQEDSKQPAVEEEIKAESSGNQVEQEQQSSVIMRRQVITTAGTIEDEAKAQEQAEAVETIESEAQNEGSPQSAPAIVVQFQEQPSSQIEQQERYENNNNEPNNYTSQQEYTQVGATVQYEATVNIPLQHVIGSTQYETQDETKRVVYADLQSVQSPSFANPQSYTHNDGAIYMQQHQYQSYGQHYDASRNSDDSPPNTLVHGTDPTLSSRIYSVSATIKFN